MQLYLLHMYIEKWRREISLMRELLCTFCGPQRKFTYAYTLEFLFVIVHEVYERFHHLPEISIFIMEKYSGVVAHKFVCVHYSTYHIVWVWYAKWDAQYSTAQPHLSSTSFLLVLYWQHVLKKLHQSHFLPSICVLNIDGFRFRKYVNANQLAHFR